MAAVVYATPGTLHLTPTSAAVGGTAIPGILERDISFSPGIETRRRRTGVGASAGFRYRRGRVAPDRLFISLRNQSATALKIIFAHLTTDGATIRPTGGTATAPFAKLPTFALVVRPDLTTEKYIYAPNWQLTDESVGLVVHSDDASQLEGSQLVLEAARPTNATGPACMWDTAANINTAFGL